jgi:hypothetical protein
VQAADSSGAPGVCGAGLLVGAPPRAQRVTPPSWRPPSPHCVCPTEALSFLCSGRGAHAFKAEALGLSTEDGTFGHADRFNAPCSRAPPGASVNSRPLVLPDSPPA